MGEPLWKFEGFETDAGNPVVQDWFWDDIGDDERDDIRSRVNYLSNLPRNLWKEPHFKWLGKIGEIRKSTTKGALRLYGYFPVDRPGVFVLLNGTIKKSNKDNPGIETAELRRKKLQQQRGATNGFDFEERPTSEMPPEQSDEKPSSIQ
jgi:hypothetical protein